MLPAVADVLCCGAHDAVTVSMITSVGHLGAGYELGLAVPVHSTCLRWLIEGRLVAGLASYRAKTVRTA